MSESAMAGPSLQRPAFPVDPALFGPDAFRARALARTTRDPEEARAHPVAGDHGLNPGFVRTVHERYREAAVLIPVVAHRPEASVILTRRTDHLASHAGQIAFPGGKVDAGDASPQAAALREAWEEIGLEPARVEPLGYLPAYLTNSGFRIMPVVALVEPGFTLAINPGEVADVFEVPLSFLMSADNHRIGSRVYAEVMRYFYEMPYGDRYIWGVTAGIIRQFYERVFHP